MPSQCRNSDARNEQQLSTIGELVLRDGTPVEGHAGDAIGWVPGYKEPDVGAEELAGSVVTIHGDALRDGDAHGRGVDADVDRLGDARHFDAKPVV